jgi:hypothetical protein
MRHHFTADDARRAHEEWGANYGPGALAAITGLTLDEVRSHLQGFDGKRYTNPTMMFGALDSIGLRWRRLPAAEWPAYGLARIQWHGPWMRPGVSIGARYRRTHWIGACSSPGTVAIFDINAMANGSGWCSLKDWGEQLVPWLLKECMPQADGDWTLTHAIEVERCG